MVQVQLRCCYFEHTESVNLKKAKWTPALLFLEKAYCIQVDLFWGAMIVGYNKIKYFKIIFKFLSFFLEIMQCCVPLQGILLTEAEESLSHLVQNIQDKYDGEVCRCSAEDLEALIEAKLQLAAISQQRHQAAFR